MAVKVCINGQMKKIDTALHKPVIFLNGQKKVLSKAWMFVNGEKKMLWGQPGVQVDLIKSDGIVSSTNRIKAIGDDWLVMATFANQINRIDISNISNPTLLQTVSWGDSLGDYRNSGYLSDSTKFVFYGVYGDTLNRMACDYSTGVVTVEKSYVMSNSERKIGDIGNSSIGSKDKTRSINGGSLRWGSDVYVNNSLAYSVGNYSSTSSYGPLISFQYLQYSSSAWYIRCLAQGSYSSQNGLSRMTISEITKINSTSINSLEDYFLDGNNIAGVYPTMVRNTVELIDKDLLSVVSSNTLGDTNYEIKLVGRIGSCYYVIKIPRSRVNNLGLETTLYLLDATDLTNVVYTQTLPTDPFGEYNGTGEFWNNCFVCAQNSGSGFLGVSEDASGKIRVVRFSELLN